MNTTLSQATPQALTEAATLIRQGELVAFPTETVYGLGANALDPQAVLRIFAAKGRPADNPLIVHVAEKTAVEPLCVLNANARLLMERFWPGPLTLLLPKRPCIPPEVNAGLDSVAVRMPSHPVARAFLRACGVPVAAPSANRSGKPSPTTAAHVLRDMDGLIPLILDGGPCDVGVESTVLSLTGDAPTVLRPGGVTPEMLRQYLPEVRVVDSVMRPLRPGESAPSPGMRYKHYAPAGEVVLVSGAPSRVIARCAALYDAAEQSGQSARILTVDEHLSGYGARRTLSLGTLADPETIARSLFAALRRMDDEGAARIYCEAFSQNGVGLAIMNRLGRAAAFRIVDADAEVAP